MGRRQGHDSCAGRPIAAAPCRRPPWHSSRLGSSSVHPHCAINRLCCLHTLCCQPSTQRLPFPHEPGLPAPPPAHGDRALQRLSLLSSLAMQAGRTTLSRHWIGKHAYTHKGHSHVGRAEREGRAESGWRKIGAGKQAEVLPLPKPGGIPQRELSDSAAPWARWGQLWLQQQTAMAAAADGSSCCTSNHVLAYSTFFRLKNCRHERTEAGSDVTSRGSDVASRPCCCQEHALQAGTKTACNSTSHAQVNPTSGQQPAGAAGGQQPAAACLVKVPELPAAEGADQASGQDVEPRHARVGRLCTAEDSAAQQAQQVSTQCLAMP